MSWLKPEEPINCYYNSQSPEIRAATLGELNGDMRLGDGTLGARTELQNLNPHDLLFYLFILLYTIAVLAL